MFILNRFYFVFVFKYMCVNCARGGAVRLCGPAAFQEVPRPMWASALASTQATDSCRRKPVRLSMGRSKKEAEGERGGEKTIRQQGIF